MSSPPDTVRPGLRERKKAKTRAAIQAHALRLFREQGYHATTVEQIADAAEVSPSTFFRYFPTKEDVVIYDDFDPRMVEALLAQPAELSPVAALRRALRQVFEEAPTEATERERQRHELARTVPEVRSRMLDGFISGLLLLAEAFAERTGRAPDDLAVRTLAGAIVGIGVGAMLTADEMPGDFLREFDAHLAQLEAGLDFSAPAAERPRARRGRRR
jgi:AcrR family transcriptional regulator